MTEPGRELGRVRFPRMTHRVHDALEVPVQQQRRDGGGEADRVKVRVLVVLEVDDVHPDRDDDLLDCLVLRGGRAHDGSVFFQEMASTSPSRYGSTDRGY